MSTKIMPTSGARNYMSTLGTRNIHADRKYGNCMPTGNMGTACRHAGELHADRKNA